jgi:putative transposon-encoded protein
MQPSMKVEVRAYQVIEKVVKASGSSGRVYVPPDWIGKRVKILLLEPIAADEDHKD